MRKTYFSFIHCADLHLDSPFEGIHSISPNIAEVLRVATFKAFDNLIDLAIRRKVDFIIIAGDVYDGADRSLRAQWRFHQALGRAVESGIQCFLVHGNHDPLSSWEAGLSIPPGAHRFDGERVDYITAKRGNEELARIYGISYPSREIRYNLVDQFPKDRNQIFSIGVLHCNVGGSPEHDNYAPCTLDDLISCNMDYWALGHIHTRSILRENRPWIIYPGNTQGRSVRETDARGCYLVKVGDSGIAEAEFLPTDVVRWAIEKIYIDNFSNMDHLMDVLYQKRENIRSSSSGRPVILRFYIYGRGDLHRELGKQVSDITASLRDGEEERKQFVWVESIQVQTRPAIDISQRRQVEDFVGEFLKATEDLRKSQDACSKIRGILNDIPGFSVIADQIECFSENDLLSILDESEITGLDMLLSGED